MDASSSAWRGVRYAFGRGMDPRKKDGVRAHPWVFAAGLLLHLAIAGAILTLALGVIGTAAHGALGSALLVLTIAGVAAGAALFLRRLREPVLQAISVPDDYASNLLVVAFVASAAASLVTPAAFRAFALVTAVLAAYAPFSKIRHCILFFVTRARFGAFIGVRGVLAGRSRG